MQRAMGGKIVQYIINSDKKIMKKVLAIISLLFLVLNGNAQESLDTIKSFTLSEVVVKAERIIHKGDHDVLYLSNDNKKFGTNALDAVSSLELFQTAINETKLVSWDRQNVFILIMAFHQRHMTYVDIRVRT